MIKVASIDVWSITMKLNGYFEEAVAAVCDGKCLKA
jgi:hypothetical protein